MPHRYRLLILSILIFISGHAFAKSTCDQMTTTEQKNIKLVTYVMTHMHDVWKTALKTDDSFDKIFAKDFIFSGIGVTEDYDRFRSHFASNYKNWRSVNIKIENIFGRCDQVALRAVVIGVANNGKEFKLNFLSIFQIENGKIKRWWDEEFPNSQDVLKSIGQKY